MVGVLRQSEDYFVGAFVVVGIEELCIIAVERVTLGNRLFASIDAFRVLGSAGIGLGIQVKLCKQSVGSAL